MTSTSSEYIGSKVGFPIRKFSDQSLFAAPQDLSQRTTSFIASWCQGIHRTPLSHFITSIIDARHSAGRLDKEGKTSLLIISGKGAVKRPMLW